MCATNMPTSGTAREKLKWIFEMYDEDRSGAIGMSEMLEILSTLYDMEGASKDNLETIARNMFIKMEIDESEELTLEQFTSACLTENDIIYLLKGQDTQD